MYIALSSEILNKINYFLAPQVGCSKSVLTFLVITGYRTDLGVSWLSLANYTDSSNIIETANAIPTRLSDTETANTTTEPTSDAGTANTESPSNPGKASHIEIVTACIVGLLLIIVSIVVSVLFLIFITWRKNQRCRNRRIQCNLQPENR